MTGGPDLDAADHDSGLPLADLPVAGVVLAAGRSSRMGENKALLGVEGATFLERAVRILRSGGCSPVFAIVPPGERAGRMGALTVAGGGIAIENPDAGAEQVDSLRVGLAAMGPEPAAAVVLPVDYPLTRERTVAALIAAFRARAAPIVRPVRGGRPGHPVLFARDTWSELSAPQLDAGARDVVHRHRAAIEEVPVDDEGVLMDVNTPEEYTRALGEPPRAIR